MAVLYYENYVVPLSVNPNQVARGLRTSCGGEYRANG